MARTLRWTGIFLGALIALILAAVAWIWISSSTAMGRNYEGVPEKLVQPTAAQLADGARQLRILGCVSCHGEGLRGDLLFSEPNVATVYAPNLTLTAAKADDQQLARAIRQGIGTDGRALFAMPSAQYARLSDAEIAALIVAIRALPVGGEQVAPIDVGPIGRLGLAMGKFPSQPDEVERFKANPPAAVGNQYEAGRKLVMVNCAECHGPALKGGEPKPGLMAPDLVVAGAYDLPEFQRLMRTGVPTGNRKLEMMSDIARRDLSHYTDAEIAAMHAYLQERAMRVPQ